MKRDRGFTLVEVAVVLVILALITAMWTGVVRGITALQRASSTQTKLDTATEALTSFVRAYGRLPCPADGSLDASDAQAGRERRDANGDCSNLQRFGVVPWLSMGLTEDAVIDGYGARLMYRVAPGLTRQLSMRMEGCDPAGTGPAQTAPVSRPPPGAGLIPETMGFGPPPNQACVYTCVKADPLTCTSVVNVLAGRGLEVRNGAGVPQTTAAAYVLLSHGENRAGGYAASTGLILAAVGATGPGEAQNAASAPLAPFYTDTAIDTTPADYFDDIVRRPTVLAVVTKAGTGPRPPN
jgi:prepilin-type N-terminal cleavage/methylation domain-containing protein